MTTKECILEAAINAANWITRNQSKPEKIAKGESRTEPRWGTFVFGKGQHYDDFNIGPEWVGAFSSLACHATFEAIKDQSYFESAKLGAKYLQTLQIFDPWNKKHYGAFREYTTMTSWCYVRDAVSAAWAMTHFYRETKKDHYLTSALAFYDWLLREGLDKHGYPMWGVTIDEDGYAYTKPEMNPHLEGTFHGGSLNLFYQLFKATGDKKFVGKEFINLADLVIERIQHDDGSFHTFDTNTMKSVEADPQNNLHKANDDFNTLGLLCAYDITKDQKYMQAIEKFLEFALGFYEEDRGFGNLRAALPVILNIMIELENYTGVTDRFANEKEKIIDLIMKFQANNRQEDMNGGIFEAEGKDYVCSRSTQYTVIALLKYLGKFNNFLSVK